MTVTIKLLCESLLLSIETTRIQQRLSKIISPTRPPSAAKQHNIKQFSYCKLLYQQVDSTLFSVTLSMLLLCGTDEDPCHSAKKKKEWDTSCISAKPKRSIGPASCRASLGIGWASLNSGHSTSNGRLYAAFALTDAAPGLALMSICASPKNKICKGGFGIALFFTKAMHVVINGSRFIAKWSSS